MHAEAAGETAVGRGQELLGAAQQPEESGRCSCCDCRFYWRILSDPRGATLDDLLYFIRRHFYVYLIYTALSFYDAVVAAVTGGTTDTTSYYAYAVVSYVASLVYVSYVAGLILLSRTSKPDYVFTIGFRLILCVLLCFSFFLLVYSMVLGLVGLIVSQWSAIFIHSTCLYIWVHITRRILSASNGITETLVNPTGGAEV